MLLTSVSITDLLILLLLLALPTYWMLPLVLLLVESRQLLGESVSVNPRLKLDNKLNNEMNQSLSVSNSLTYCKSCRVTLTVTCAAQCLVWWKVKWMETHLVRGLFLHEELVTLCCNSLLCKPSSVDLRWSWKLACFNKPANSGALNHVSVLLGSNFCAVFPKLPPFRLKKLRPNCCYFLSSKPHLIKFCGNCFDSGKRLKNLLLLICAATITSIFIYIMCQNHGFWNDPVNLRLH